AGKGRNSGRGQLEKIKLRRAGAFGTAPGRGRGFGIRWLGDWTPRLFSQAAGPRPGATKVLAMGHGAALATAAAGAVNRLDGGHYVSGSDDGRDICGCDHCRSDGNDGS